MKYHLCLLFNVAAAIGAAALADTLTGADAADCFLVFSLTFIALTLNRLAMVQSDNSYYE